MKIVGVITRVSDGVIGQGRNAGQPWQSINVEGMQLFVPGDLQREYCRGQRVQCELLYTGDKKRVGNDGNDMGYQPAYEVLSIRVFEDRPLE